MSGLDKEIQFVKGVGPARAKALKRLGIETVEDVLFHCPRDWVDRTNIKKISDVTAGERETVMGFVVHMQTKKVRRTLSITNVVIKDDTGIITGVWYNQPYMEKTFTKGLEVIFHGKVERFRNNLQIGNPEYEISGSMMENTNANRIVPVYPLTESITQKQFRAVSRYVLDNYLSELDEYMPDEILSKYELPGIHDAFMNLHYPESFEKLKKARERIVFDEFFFLQYAFSMRKIKMKKEKGFVFNINGIYKEKFRENMPFKLTGAQRRVVEEIKKDFVSGEPMNRLLQGDVGSGKTVVALIAAVIAKDSGFQSAIMAPTEILASQHMKTITQLLEGTEIRVEVLLGGTRKKARNEILDKLKNNEIDILIGTHAIIQEDVVFNKLGLIVIDEQHRFGVMQRKSLNDKANLQPHTLIMSATPIPRTLSLTVYGDTDVSVIDELPPGRKKIQTMLFEENEKEKLYTFIEQQLGNGAQVYAVYPLVDESDKVDLKSAIEMEKEWTKRFSQFNIELIHGKMKKAEKEEIMNNFRRKKTHVLVSTTVIEVGVDVPNASVMVIEHAERFGLSQLHQLRGRVGRGDKQSYCILVGDPSTENGIKRLNVMAETDDGFKISEEDLALRGPGEFMGVRQHGLPEFRVANIISDRKIMEKSRNAAISVLSDNCDIGHRKKTILTDKIMIKYGQKFGLLKIG